jgi:hypothetical protein
VEDAMTKDDAQELADLAKHLPAIDLDNTSAERMALRARQDLGKGPPKGRLLLPILAVIVVVVYLGWIILKLVELTG